MVPLFITICVFLVDPLWLVNATDDLFRTSNHRKAERSQASAERHTLARYLHASAAWHCGCAVCVPERLRTHGDVARRQAVVCATPLGTRRKHEALSRL
jgi:hypothetical protein